MKKIVLSGLLLLSSLGIFAQENEKDKKSDWGFQVEAKLGFATLVQNNQVDLNGSANIGGFSLFYSNAGSTISLGAEQLQFKANGVSIGESYALDQKYLRIPLNYTYSLSILSDQFDDKLRAYGGMGVYASTLLSEKIQTNEENFKNKNQGWNGGFGFELGVDFKVNRDLIFGIGFETQSDFSKMKKNEFERKLEGIATVNFKLQYVIN